MCCACVGVGYCGIQVSTNFDAKGDEIVDSEGDGCASYEQEWCGGYDTLNFNSMQMCCVCGGGQPKEELSTCQTHYSTNYHENGIEIGDGTTA